MLHPFWDASLVGPTRPQINTKSLLRWLVQMQGLPIEMGGFKGRTNKLVDGCYSWWVGGSLNLLAALGVSFGVPGNVDQSQDQDDGQDWHNVDGESDFFILLQCVNIRVLHRLFLQSRSLAGVYPLCRATPSRWLTRQASEVRVTLLS